MKNIMMILLLASFIVAAPKIKVEQATFDFGTVPAGDGQLRHTFKITNIGDEILKIDDVKAGCSCTVVEFKPELKPGESSNVVAALSIKDRTGSQDKPITIISNAENTPLLKLTLKAYILGPINMDRRYGIFHVLPNKMVKDSVVILSTKKDLKITSASYVIRNRNSADTTEKKVPVTVTLTPTKTKQSNGATEFMLVFFFKSNPAESEAGTIFFNTNHPENPKLEFRCMIEVNR